MSAIILAALTGLIVTIANAMQTVIQEWIRRKAAPVAREKQADLTVQKLANSQSKFRAVSEEGMSSPTSASGIFWKDRAEKQEETLASIRRIIYSSQYDAGPKSMKAIESLLTPKPGESSDISITIPGKDRK